MYVFVCESEKKKEKPIESCVACMLAQTDGMKMEQKHLVKRSALEVRKITRINGFSENVKEVINVLLRAVQ